MQDFFGYSITFSRMDKKLPLPIYLSEREVYEARCEGISFIVVEIKDDEQFTISALKNQLVQYIECTGKNVCFNFPSVTKIERNELLKNKIPFLMIPNQVYLPFLGIVLNDIFKKEKKYSKQKMMPLTQVLFLFLLYQKEDKPILKTEIANRLGITKMSITRASEQLMEMELLHLEKNGRDNFVSRNGMPREYYERAKPFLINPIQKIVCVDSKTIPNELYVAGESALSQLSLLNAPKISDYAISKEILNVQNLELLSEQWDQNDTMCHLQLWKYNPALFAKDGIVDIVSLICSYGNVNEQDERVQMCIDEAMENYKW